MKVGDRRVGTSVAGRFRIDSLIGEGQMARVYVAEQMSMKRQVALKIMHHDLLRHKAAPTRFRREVEAVTRLRSPHSIVFFDFGSTDDGSLYIAMELLTGEPLRVMLERERGLEPGLVLSIVRQICGCLREAHNAGVLHRDLKPENIFLCPPEPGGRGPFVKVLDFGLAKLSEPAFGEDMPPITSPSVTVGTPAYLAPEMAVSGRRADSRSDLYSLGVMVYEMLTGERPFNEKNPHAMMVAHTRAPIPQPSKRKRGLPPGTDGFIQVAMAKDPEERFQNAEAFGNALASALGDRRSAS
jgi:serine/threonine-protein kinase